MLAMPRLSGSAAALIAALASYRPLPNPPRRPAERDRRSSGEPRPDAKAAMRSAARQARRR